MPMTTGIGRLDFASPRHEGPAGKTDIPKIRYVRALILRDPLELSAPKNARRSGNWQEADVKFARQMRKPWNQQRHVPRDDGVTFDHLTSFG